MNEIRQNTIINFLWGFMGFYLLNISIDTGELNFFSSYKNTVYNDQESIIEFIAEKVLGFENTFSEFDDPDYEDHHKSKSFKIELVINSGNLRSLNLQLRTACNYAHKMDPDILQGYQTLSKPPPEV